MEGGRLKCLLRRETENSKPPSFVSWLSTEYVDGRAGPKRQMIERDEAIRF